MVPVGWSNIIVIGGHLCGATSRAFCGRSVNPHQRGISRKLRYNLLRAVAKSANGAAPPLRKGDENSARMIVAHRAFPRFRSV